MASAEYHREYRDKNRLKIRAINDKARQKSRLRNRRFVHRYKTFCGCAACGFNEHPSALVFHHLDPATKSGEVADMASDQASMKRMKAEIRKCIVLCSNCHAMVHAGVIDIKGLKL